jgi:hypothetical protein
LERYQRCGARAERRDDWQRCRNSWRTGQQRSQLHSYFGANNLRLQPHIGFIRNTGHRNWHEFHRKWRYAACEFEPAGRRNDSRVCFQRKRDEFIIRRAYWRRDRSSYGYSERAKRGVLWRLNDYCGLEFHNRGRA